MARRIVLTSESLVRLTCHVTAFRFRLENERNERQKLMALQIKGLRENMLALRGLVSELNGQTAGAIEKGTQLKGHIGDLSTELAAHVSDIEFAAGIMGNSPPGSGNGSGAAEKPKERPIEKKVTEAGEVWTITLDADAARGKPAERPNIEASDSDANQPKAAAEPPLVRLGPNPSQQEAGETPATTFHDL